MRALIAGIVVVGGVSTACTAGSSYGTARYSGDTAPTPVVARRNAPVWPSGSSTPAPSVLAQSPAPTPVPSYVPPRTAAPQPIVLSSRPSPSSGPVPAPARVSTMLPPPASHARTAAELAAALRPINATCPVMLGSPIDPSVTASYQGRVVAFSDARSRSAWLADTERYARNLPGTTGFGSSSDGPVFASASASPTRSNAYSVSPRGPSAYPPAPPPPAVVRRPVYATPEVSAPSYPVYPAAPPPAAPPTAFAAPVASPAPVAAKAPAPAPAAADDEEAGGVCVGGNCALPTRRK